MRRLGLTERQKDFQDRFCQLVLNYARDDAIDKLGIQDDFGEVYEPEEYLDLQNDLVFVDFVGPVEVILELWALENGLLQRRSSHQVIPPQDDIVELNASDLIPQEFVDPNNDRKVAFDLSLYRQLFGARVQRPSPLAGTRCPKTKAKRGDITINYFWLLHGVLVGGHGLRLNRCDGYLRSASL